MTDSLDEWNPKEKEFHGAVREYLICVLLLGFLYSLSFAIIKFFRTPSRADALYTGDKEDYLVYRISVWICNFSLAVSIGAVFLLPFSVLGNEILLQYPNSYYVQWLNSSLIYSLWTYVFLLSNLSVFIFLPFAYFFIESQGFSGFKKGIMTRVYESATVCVLVCLVVVLTIHRVYNFFDVESSSLLQRYDEEEKGVWLLHMWKYHLPFVYSVLSFFGVSMLLLCTPFGFATMFTVVGDLITKPRKRKNLDTEILAAKLEEQTLRRRLNGVSMTSKTGRGHELFCNGNGMKRNGLEQDQEGLWKKLDELQIIREDLEKLQRTSHRWVQHVKYPLAMLLLLLLTGISVLMVVSNSVQLLVGFKSLPTYIQYIELGRSSLSTLGIFGASVEIVVLIYLMSASLVGLYSFPWLSGLLKPRRAQTSMTTVIVNCWVIVFLSSALPVLARTLGISNFDLLGAYGKIDWLRNFYLVLSCNLIFGVATGFCLVTKFTSSVRRELFKRLNEASLRIRRRHLSSESSSSELASFVLDDDEKLD